jgi:cell wall-associated NlpC family hydrolase
MSTSAPSSFKDAGKNPTRTELIAPDEEKRALGDAVGTTATTYVASSANAQGINNLGLYIPKSIRMELEERARLEKEAAANRKKQQSNKQSSTSNKVYNAPTTGNGAGVVEYALQFVGNPYVYGGTSLTNGADCSGFVMSVYAAFGVSLPHSSSAMRSVGWSVDPADVQPGDIICYSGHVAIYIGNGAIVHASTRKTGIKVSDNWQYKTVLAVRRVI